MVPAGYLSPMPGKIEIKNNTKILFAFEKSFSEIENYYYKNKKVLSNKFEENNKNFLENNKNFLENNIYELMNDLFNYKSLSASQIDLKNKTIAIDNNLQDELSQLYILAYGIWIESGKNIDSQVVQEVNSKIYKYLWRLYLIKNRLAPAYSLKNNVRLNDIQIFNIK